MGGCEDSAWSFSRLEDWTALHALLDFLFYMDPFSCLTGSQGDLFAFATWLDSRPAAEASCLPRAPLQNFKILMT